MNENNQNTNSIFEKEFQELKTFIGMFYGKYLSCETEVKELKKMIDEMKLEKQTVHLIERKRIDFPELSKEERDELNTNETKMLNNSVDEQSIENNQQIQTIQSFENKQNDFQNELNNHIIIKRIIKELNEMKDAKENNTNYLLQSSNVYFLDSLYYEELSEKSLLQLFDWIENDSLSLLFDSKTSSMKQETIKQFIQPSIKTSFISNESKKNIIVIFFTSTNEIFGFVHNKCLSETDDHYFISNQSFMFSSHNNQLIKITKKYEINSSIQELISVVYSIPFCFVVKVDEKNGKIFGKFNSNFQTYYKFDSIDSSSHSINSNWIVNSSQSFEIKRCILFDY